MLNQFVEKLSKTLSLEIPPTSDTKGEFTLSLTPSLTILLKDNPAPGITLFSTLGPLPEKKKDEFTLYAMSANLFGKETGSAFLGCDKEGKMVTLTSFLPFEANYGYFLDSLEEFANYAECWQGELTSQWE